MLEGQCQCINDIDIHKRAKYTRADKYDRMDALYFQQDQVTQTHNKSLDRSQYDKQQPSAKICAGGRKIGHFFIFVYFLLQNRNQDQTTNPQCQIGVKRCHAGTIIFHIIQYF